jgi:hypothetical protein
MTWPRAFEVPLTEEMSECGINILPFNGIDVLDETTFLGGYGGIHLHTHGMDDAICIANNRWKAEAKKAVDDLLSRYGNHPSIRYIVLNTEMWGAICFCGACKKKYEEVSGIDADLLEEWVKKGGPRRWKATVLVPPIPEYTDEPAKTGVVSEDNPLLRFGYWWWEQGGLNMINQYMADYLHKIRPDIMVTTEPVMRFGGVKRYRPPIVISDWKYPVNPADWVPVLAYLKGMQRLWDVNEFIPTMGMIKYSPPLSNFAPYQVTIPPDLLKIESWLCLANIPSGIDYFYWQAVESPEQPYWKTVYLSENEKILKGMTWEEACRAAREGRLKQAWIPGVPEAVKTLSENLYEPYGPLVKKLHLKPAKVAVLYSFTSAIMGKRTWHHGSEWMPLLEKILSGPYYADVIFDYDLEDRKVLSRYDAVILPSAYVLKESGIKALREYIDSGNLVLGGISQADNLKGMKVIAGLDKRDKEELNPQDIFSELSKVIPAEKTVDNKNIILRESEGKDTRMLFAVNNNLVAGPLLGRYTAGFKGRGEDTLEKGVPAKGKIKVLKGDWKYCYDLTAGREIRPAVEGNYWVIDADIPAAWGRIYAFYRGKPGSIMIESPDRVNPGDEVKVTVSVLDEKKGKFTGLVPVYLELFEPSGQKVRDSSHYACAEDSLYETAFTIPLLTRRNPLHTGKWTVKVTDIVSGLTAEKIVDVVTEKIEKDVAVEGTDGQPQGKYFGE